MMKTPVTVGSLAQGAVAGGVPALFLGTHIDALLAGLFAAIVASIWLDTVNDKAKAFSAIALSAVLAGYGASSLCAYAIASIPSLSGVDPQQFRILGALLIGFVTPLLTPYAVEGARNLLRGKAKP